MPPTMQPMEASRTKRARMYKGFEQVVVGPLRLYFSHFDLIGFESDKTRVVVCAGLNPGSRGSDGHRSMLEPDQAKWLSPSDFSEKWAEAGAIYFK